MNQMWGEMSPLSREEYKRYFISYHDRVARWSKKQKQQWQGSRDCGILASGMKGNGDRERRWEGKWQKKGKLGAFALIKVKMDQIEPTMDQKRLNIQLFYQHHLFFVEHTFSEEWMKSPLEEAPQFLLPWTMMMISKKNGRGHPKSADYRGV